MPLPPLSTKEPFISAPFSSCSTRRVPSAKHPRPCVFRSTRTHASHSSSFGLTPWPPTTPFERTPPMTPPQTDLDALRDRVQRLGFFGLLASWNDIAQEPWLPQLITIEEKERKRRSLERRLRAARIGSFKAMADFDWSWPSRVDREAVDDLLSLKLVDEGVNAVLIGPNGVGKTMILRNIAHEATLRGPPLRFTTASDMLSDLAAQESSAALARRLRRYVQPRLLCIDEVGYLSYENRYADLLFGGVLRRYGGPR